MRSITRPTLRSRHRRLFPGLVALALAISAGRTAAQEMTWTTSVQYSQGDYFFTESTRSWLLYNSLAWQGERLRFSLGVPAVVQDTRAVTFVGEVPIPTGGPDSEAVGRKGPGERVPMGGRRNATPSANGFLAPPLASQSTGGGDTVTAPGSYRVGLADPLLGAGLKLVRPRGAFLGLDLTASVKLPIRGIDSGVGTGELDVGIGLSTAVGRGRAMLFADAGWWSYGDPPGLELKDVVSWSVGVGGLLGSRTSGLVSLSGSSGIMDAVDPPLDASALLSVDVGANINLNLSAGVGLSEASPDFTLGVGTRVTLGG